MKDPVQQMLCPRAIAVIGASRNPEHFSFPLLQIVLRCGYRGAVYPVNPNADEILGLPCYPNVRDIPGEVDTAMIMTAKRFTAQAVEDCIAKGVRGVVIMTAGFAEQGEEGLRQQAELVAKARAAGVRIIGPNTLGFFSAPVHLDLIMSGFIREGGAALITQSGNLTQSITFPGGRRGLGFRYVVGLGNQADLQVADLIHCFREDPGAESVAVHIEGLQDGRAFMEAVSATVPRKPVLVVKSGRTESGARAAASHTASLAGDDAVYQAAFHQCGAIPVESIRDLISALLAIQTGRFPQGNRVCILSEGGGDCALTADACVRRGMTVPALSDSTRAALSEFLPPNASTANPIDLAGWEGFAAATECALADDAVDAVLLVGGFAGNFHISPADFDREMAYVNQFCETVAAQDKPVLVYSYTGYAPSRMTERLAEAGVPIFLDHHDAVNALGVLVAVQEQRARLGGSVFRAALPPPAVTEAPPPRADGYLLEPEAKALLRPYGIPFPREIHADSEDAAVAAAAEIGGPVVLKIVSEDVVHKSDAGGVRIGLSGPAAVRDAHRGILDSVRRHAPDARIQGMLVVEMAPENGEECIIGGLRDPVFGPVVMFGLGGIFVEVLRDVVFRVAPLDGRDAEEMIDEIAGAPLLRGVRGRPPLDRAALKDALLQVSRLLCEHPEIAELDLNPVRLYPKGLLALDARVRLQHPTPEPQ